MTTTPLEPPVATPPTARNRPNFQAAEGTKLWDRQPGETDHSYEAFCRYRDMGAGRSVVKVWRLQPGKERAVNPPGYYSEWCIRWAWVERTLAYDVHQELIERKKLEAEHSKEIAEYRKRAKNVAGIAIDAGIKALAKAVVGLENMKVENAKPGEVASLLRAAAAVIDSSLAAEAEAIGVRKLEILLSEQAQSDTRGISGTPVRQIANGSHADDPALTR